MFAGALRLLTGIRVLLAQPALRAVLWRISGLLLVLMLVLVGGVFWLLDYLTQLWIPQGDVWYWQIVAGLLWILALLCSLLTGIVSFAALGSAAAAPWLDELAAQTDALAGRSVQECDHSWIQQAMRSLSHSIRPLIGLLGMGLLALLCLLIPVIGQILAALIWGYAGIRFLNYELMDTTASRHDLDFQQRTAMMKRHRFFWIGFGGAAMVLMLIPVFNLLVIPASVVGLGTCYDWKA